MLDLIRHRAQSWGVKVIFGIIILVFVAWGVGSNSPSSPGTAATVNGKPISMQEFQRTLYEEEEQFRAMVPDLSRELLDSLRLPEKVMSRLVTRSLIEQEAARLGITVTPLEYAVYLRDQAIFLDKDGKFSQESYEEFVAKQGRNIGEFEQSMMRQMLVQKMEDYVTSAFIADPDKVRRRFSFELEKRVISYVLFATEEYKQDIVVTDDAIKTYYDANQVQFARPATVALNYIDVTPESLAPFMDVADDDLAKAYAAGPLRYNLRQVQLPVPDDADEATEAAMKNSLEAVATALREGTDFAEATTELIATYPDARTGESGMMESRRIPPEILGSVAGLEKDGVAPVFKMGYMLILSQLIETDPDWTLPETDINAALRLALGKEKASLAFHDVQIQAEDLVALAKPLTEIAAELNMAIKTSEPAPREALINMLQLRKAEQIALFDAAQGSLVNGLLETQEGFVVAEIKETTPAGVAPLDDMKEFIRETLILREAEKKAEEAARAVIAEFADGTPEAYKDKIVTTEPFVRQGVIPLLGYAKSLSDAVFAAPLDNWLKEPFATPTGAVIAMPVEILPLQDAEWATHEARATESFLNSQKNQMMNAFVADLHKNADIVIPHPEIFGPQ